MRGDVNDVGAASAEIGSEHALVDVNCSRSQTCPRVADPWCDLAKFPDRRQFQIRRCHSNGTFCAVEKIIMRKVSEANSTQENEKNLTNRRFEIFQQHHHFESEKFKD